MQLVYVGERLEAVDVPRARIVNWKRGETREVPAEIAASLLERPDEFRALHQAEAVDPIQHHTGSVEDIEREVEG